ncbi:trypsin-1-like [Anopheles merus]|uniref:Peptidase S1 domain-containing protein n=1 Tax=Anopheles merus TaxID=30066 RepID=A0A182VJE3_ANOME|nr:trypsin-1-like [Anopheles merus]
MRPLFFATLLCLAALAKGQRRQIGGTDVSIVQYPFVVGILLQRTIIIGNGAILAPSWVLTSASAVFNTPDSEYSIATGSEDLFTPAAQYQVQRIFRHPEFVGWDYNVALVKVSGKIVFGDTVQPIAIATTEPETVNDATMLSYGKNEDGTAHLRSATYTLISDNDDCVRLLQEYQAKEVIWQHHGFCLIPPPGTQQGQWFNDAGAPLVADGQLYAVFAFAENEGGTNEGSVATRLTSFAGWIQSIMFSNR